MIGTDDVEILAEDLFEENTSGVRPIEDLRERVVRGGYLDHAFLASER